MAISIGWLISAAVFSIRATILYFHGFDSNPYPCCFLFAQTPPLAIAQRSCGEQLPFDNGDLLNQMNEISRRATYPESLRSALNEAIDLVNLLREQPNKTQRFEQNSQHFDQYYALPLFTFISSEAMSQYFASNSEEPEDQRFRDILANYIQSVYPVGNILPIAHKFKNFPFVVFRSYSLNEIRSKIFTEKYFLSSNELNILNMILSKKL